MKTCRITLGSRAASTKTLELVYEIFDTSIARRWTERLAAALEAKAKLWDDGHFYGRHVQTEEALVEEMLRSAAVLEHCEQVGSPPLGLRPGLTRPELTTLHDYYESLEGRTYEPELPPAVHDAIRALNVQIHQLEQFLHPDSGIHIQAIHNHSRSALEEADYALFTPDYKFGYLYLGYATTGMPVLDSYFSRSTKTPVPQREFSDEFMLWFRSDHVFREKVQLESWLKENFGWDARDPKMALGSIPLGRLVLPRTERRALLEQLKGFDRIVSVALEDAVELAPDADFQFKDKEKLRIEPILFASSADRETSWHTAEWIHSTGENQWQGWYCSSGMRSLYVDFDGNVFTGTCGVGGWYGNVFRQGLAPDKNLNQWIRCTAKACQCGSDMFAPKVRDKSLIPANFDDIYAPTTRAPEDPGAYRPVERVKRPDIVYGSTSQLFKQIIWDLTRRCNYSCSYCFPDAHNNYEAHKSLGSLKHAVDGLHDWWLAGTPGLFVITGGEPTTNPNYLEFISYILARNPSNAVHTTSNGSRNSVFYSELLTLSNITFSGHMESLENPSVSSRFLENIEACVKARRTDSRAARHALQVRLMLKPGTLSLVRDLAAAIADIPHFHEEATLACDLLHQASDKTRLKPYTPEERDFAAREL